MSSSLFTLPCRVANGLISPLFFFVHQILVPLPEAEARQAMFEELLPANTSKLEVPYDILVEKTEGYSGSDIRLVCKEAAMQPLRRLMSVLEASDELVPEEGKFWFFCDFYFILSANSPHVSLKTKIWVLDL